MNIIIAMPVAQANVKMHATQTVVDTAMALQGAGHRVQFLAAEFSEVVWARNYLASHALAQGADRLFFIDSDMYFPPEVALALLAADKPVIGAICPRRQMSLDLLVETARKNPSASAAQVLSKVVDYNIRPTPQGPVFVDGVAEVLGVGMAVAMIRIDVLRTMVERQAVRVTAPRAGVAFPVHSFFEPIQDEAGADLSEDISFCARWVACGGHVHAMDGPRVGHVGDFVYRGGYQDSRTPAPAPLRPSAGVSISIPRRP